MERGGHCGEARAGRRVGGTGGARRERTALAAERREWAQRCDSDLVGVCAAAGVDDETCPKEEEQEQWRRVQAQ
jgi:hypothetical protein